MVDDLTTLLKSVTTQYSNTTRHSPRGIFTLHEMSIVQALLEQVQTEVDKSGHSGRVVSLHLVIGKLSGVHVDSIRFAFELLAPDSIARDAQLTIDQPKALLCCRECGEQKEIDELHASCSACGTANVIIQGGQDLLLQSIELED